MNLRVINETATPREFYWRIWLWWHARFEWCLCRCDFCGHRFVHAVSCKGTSRIRRLKP